MAKFFAVTIIVIAILSAVPILRHTWAAPEDISTHGHLIDEQMSETMVEAGLSFLAAQFLLAIFVWQFSNRGPESKIKNFPGGAKVLVIAAVLVVGVEVLALGIFGVKASGGRISDRTIGQRDAHPGSGRAVRLLFPLSRSGRQYWARFTRS